MSTIRIIFADLNVHELHMYKEDGTKIVILQGDPRIAKLVDKVFPDMRKQNFCDLPEELLNRENHYNQTEKKMNGFVRFFKLAKAKLDEIIGNAKEPVVLEPRTAGDVVQLNNILHPVAPTVKEVITDEAEQSAPLTKSDQAVAEIMAHAKPSSDRTFQDVADSEQATVAVLADGTIIENADKLEVQLQAVNAGLSSEQGLKNFLDRLSKVDRAHSAQDLLTFMEKGELPIADDGTVLVYKRLKSTKDAGVYVDCHSGKVKQKVGSRVFMDEKLVDPNRHHECSNGLHVARRDYLHSFSGDVCVLAKLAPEDVIAVPHGDARKLRAKGYHIIAVLSKEDHDRVTRNQPLKDENLLGNAVAGNHVGVLQHVQITEHYGGGVIYTDLIDGKAEFKADETLSKKSLDTLPAEGKVKVNAVAVAKAVDEPVFTEPKETKKVFAEEKPAPATKPMTKLQVLETDFLNAVKGSATEHAAAVALVDFKKSSKKSWTALGIPVAVFDRASALANQPAPVAKAREVIEGKVPTEKVKVGKATVTKQADPAKKQKKAAKPVKATRNIGPITKVTDKPAETFWEAVEAGLKGDKAAAERAFAFKKAKKKGWNALGVTPVQLAKLEKVLAK